jgi:ubiquinone/menaquinone biosynthesis C-methylase UbiE
LIMERQRNGRTAEKQRFWDGEWRKYTEMSSTNGPITSWAIAKSDLRNILDIGCGDLKFGAVFGKDRQVVCIDISEVALEKAQEYIARWSIGGSIKLVQADSSEIPLMDNSFDAVISQDTMTLLGNEFQQTLNEMVRVSRDYVVFNVTHIDSRPTNPVEGIELRCFDERMLFDVLDTVPAVVEELRVMTKQEAYNQGKGIYEQTIIDEGERKWEILAVVRKLARSV